MKKQYIIPQTEVVNVRLKNSVLDAGGYADWSYGAGGGGDDEYGDAKKQNMDFEDDSEDVAPAMGRNLWDN